MHRAQTEDLRCKSVDYIKPYSWARWSKSEWRRTIQKVIYWSISFWQALVVLQWLVEVRVVLLAKEDVHKVRESKYSLNTLTCLENSEDNKPHESLVQLAIPFTCPNTGQFHLAANSALTVQQRTVHLATINTTNPHFKYRPQLEISC